MHLSPAAAGNTAAQNPSRNIRQRAGRGQADTQLRGGLSIRRRIRFRLEKDPLQSQRMYSVPLRQ